MGDVALVLGAALVGAVVVGPALNHAITWWIGWRVIMPSLLGRVPPAAELGRARARCAGCDAALAPAGLPARPATAVAWRCPGCRRRLPGWLTAVEAITAALFGCAAAVVGPHLTLLPVLALTAGLVAMSVVDLAVHRIPTRFVYVTGLAVAAGLVLATAVDGPWRRLGGAVAGAAALGLLLLVPHLVSPRMLGFGDVRLATLVGMTAGWFGWTHDLGLLGSVQAALDVGLLAALIGVGAGLLLLAIRRRDRPFPFGPAIAAAGLLVVLSLA